MAARRLTESGLKKLAAARPLAGHNTQSEFLLVDLLAGIGGFRRAWDLLGIPVAGHLFSECKPEACRVIQAAWPDALSLGVMKNIHMKQVKQLRQKFSRVKYVFVGAGIVGPEEWKLVQVVLSLFQTVFVEADFFAIFETVPDADKDMVKEL